MGSLPALMARAWLCSLLHHPNHSHKLLMLNILTCIQITVEKLWKLKCFLWTHMGNIIFFHQGMVEVVYHHLI